MTKLLINVDHVATLRNAREEERPDPVEAARLCEEAGADGIVFHLREDRRHIRDDDVARLKDSVRGRLDFELSLSDDIVDICIRTRPDLATLVPERREELTTEGGLDVIESMDRLRLVIPRLHKAGIEVAAFVEPDVTHVEAAHEAGCDSIELHTGAYAQAADAEARQGLLPRFTAAATRAQELGLEVHAGHGLDYDNYPLFGQTVPNLHEVSIGFAIIAEAIYVGLPEAVRRMVQTVQANRV